MASVARHNRESLEAAEYDGLIGIDWVVAAEIGEALPLPLTIIEIDENGVGCQEQCIQSPIRLLVPTLFERAKYGDDAFVASHTKPEAAGTT